jgi:hypothetical protein
MKKIQDLDAAIENCIRFIKKEQMGNGSFSSFSSEQKEFKKYINRETTFITSLILICLKEAGAIDSAGEIISKGIDFLMSEKSERWTWNYWQRKSMKYAEAQIPDDLDDTFCAVSAIALHLSNLINGESMSAITRTLMLSETDVGGPYATWCIEWKKHRQWFDVDMGVNANIAYFLHTQDVHLPKLTAFFENFIRQPVSTSHYYDKTILFYFISKFYGGTLKDLLKKKVSSLKSNNLITECMRTTSLLCLGETDNLFLSGITQIQTAALKKSFPVFPLYIEENKQRPSYAGSAAMTAALCLEALLLFKKKIQQQEKIVMDIERLKIKEKIVSNTKDILHLFPQKIRFDFEKIITTMISNDFGDQITLLPYIFYKSLKKQKTLPKKLLIKLGTANLCGWLAYKIYDDILDDEGDPLYLSAANACLRKVSELYAESMPHAKLHLFNDIMNNVDTANSWERLYCKISPVDPISLGSLPDFGNYDVLSRKSFAHALGPLCILLRSQLKDIESESEMGHLRLFFHHYIIARQLNDDAHDWADDLKRGFLNSISVSLVKTYSKKYHLSAVTIDSGLLEELRKEFWVSHIQDVTEDIFFHLSSARTALSNLNMLENKSFFQRMLVPVEAAAKQALEERELTLSFLGSYSTV